MLAGWPSAGEARHSLGNGCETCACSERLPGEVPRSPVEKRGSDEAGYAGSAALRVAHFAKAKPQDACMCLGTERCPILGAAGSAGSNPDKQT